MDDLNLYMAANHFDAGLRARLREYFHRAKHLHDSRNQSRLLDMMSPALQSEVVLAANSRWLRGVWFLSNECVEDQFIVCLTMALTRRWCSPRSSSPRLASFTSSTAAS